MKAGNQSNFFRFDNRIGKTAHRRSTGRAASRADGIARHSTGRKTRAPLL